jgi:predicted transcriptional regulator
METTKLLATGLTKNQAEAYALLVEQGEISPPLAAAVLHLSRTNTYKLFDKLVELGLAFKKSGNKSIYQLSNPIALTALAAKVREEATVKEEAINNIMKTLLAKYYKHTEQPSIAVVSGKHDVADVFRNQINLNEDIYFIRTPADIPLMGFETMHEIRISPSRLGSNRYGILPDEGKGPINYKSHERSNLTTTWMKYEDYNSPVEWSVTESSLLIILYGVEPHAITITNPVVAGAFLQLWHLRDNCLKAMPYYKSLPHK